MDRLMAVLVWLFAALIELCCAVSPTEQHMRMATITLLITLLPLNLYAEPLVDPNLPSVKPEALQQLTDNRVRQRIMQESQSHYSGRCVCQYQTQTRTVARAKGGMKSSRRNRSRSAIPGR